MINISKRNWNNIQNTWKGMPMILRIPLIFTLHFASIAKTTEKAQNNNINIFQTAFQMKLVKQFF